MYLNLLFEWAFTIKSNGIYVNRIYIHLISIIFILVLFFLWVNIVQHFASAASTDLFEVVYFSTHYTHLSIHWASSGLMNETTAPASLSYLVFWSVLLNVSHFAFALCFLQILCQSLLFCVSFLGWLIVHFVPQLFLPMPGLVNLSYYHFFYFVSSFYNFYIHVIVIQPMFKMLFQLPINFLVVAFCGGYS